MERPLNEWNLVIKVKYGDALKRFGGCVQGRSMDYDMSKLRRKIVSSFNLSPDAELILTYTDEDGDIITLGDDDDLHDAAVGQHLNPLRINVQLKSSTGRHSDPESQTENHTPKTSPEIKNQPPHISIAVDEALKSLPEPLCSALSKLSQDFFLKTMSSAPAFALFMDHFSKLGLPIANQPSQKMDVNISDGPKVTNDSGSASTAILSTDTADPVSEVMQKHCESDNMNLGGMVKVPVDLNMDIPKTSHASGYPSIDDLLTPVWPETQAPIWVTDDYMHEKETSDAHHKGKSIISSAPPYLPPFEHTGDQISRSFKMPNPFVAPTPWIPDIMNVAQQFPYPSASNHEFSSPIDVPINKHIGVPTPDVPLPSGFFPIGHPYRRGDGNHESMLRTFHRGVRCDGCGMHPIMGPRFKSNVKEDYDLCGICFSEMGNEADYTRIDRASSSHRLYKDLYNTHSRYRFPISRAVHGCGMRPSRTKLESRFIRDVTVLDGTLMPCSTPFTKIWRMRNNGTTRWPYGTQIVWVGGDQFANRRSVQLEIPTNGCSADTEIDIAVDFTAPSRPGRYISYWRLASPSGQKFGQRVWVLIQVDTSRPNSFSNNFPADLNLNLPPESTVWNEFGIIDVNAVPLDAICSEPNLPTTSSELVKPLVTEVLSNSVEPATTDGIAQPAPAGGSSVSCPIIDFPASSSHASPVAVLPPPETVRDDNPVEQTLLKELEEMGFEQIDLNKEVLRLNEYNLEQSVDDLCGFAEWDPLLSELQAMGFTDKERNKKLLIENGGSIKRVVLDLIAGEKGE